MDLTIDDHLVIRHIGIASSMIASSAADGDDSDACVILIDNKTVTDVMPAYFKASVARWSVVLSVIKTVMLPVVIIMAFLCVEVACNCRHDCFSVY
eukprot:scaffold195676_cov16-Prasinocladus_malaysianus.AAC.1